MRIIFFIPFILISLSILGQESFYSKNYDWNRERHAWSSFWVTHPSESNVDYGVFLFRNAFELDEVPEEFEVYVSGDNRYRLFINGEEVSFGPARGSLQYWRYETLDISPYLKKGNNIIAAEVFNLGPMRPVAQFSNVTAFIFQSELLSEQLNTGVGTWKVTINRAYHARTVTSDMVLGKYYVAGPCDSIVAASYPFGWETDAFTDNDWLQPKIVQRGSGRGYMHGSPWMLVPRNIPMMEQKIVRFSSIARQSEGLDFNKVIKGAEKISIPANFKLSILIDQKQLSMGFPELFISGGLGSKIKATYSEALFDESKKKGNRNEIDGKEIYGYSDVFIPDGKMDRLFRPLWIRTFRFVQLDIETMEDPLTINDYYFKYTAYPFEEKGIFSSDNEQLTDIWQVGWRTARLCALETYMDCPYWEQLQYLGDTRIQSLISLYVAGDDRLMRNVLLTADRSRMPEGLTMARGPTFVPQITPPFSLYWVDMVHDYFMHRNDAEFIEQFLPGIEAVLGWFERRMDDNGMLGPLDWFNFSDWTPGFMCGAPAGVDDGNSALITLNFAYSLERAAELFSFFGEFQKSVKYKSMAESMVSSVYSNCYNKDRDLLADTPLMQEYSQHTNIWGILTNTFPEDQAQVVMKKILDDDSLIQTTIYFKFYLFEALKKAGLADLYLEQLGPWYDMLDEGLTTFEEGDYDDRSDCHAWGSSPLYHFMSIVGGVTPSAPGFKRVSIKPAFGKLNEIKVTIPHPEGDLSMELKKNLDNSLTGMVILPDRIKGIFEWNGKQFDLHEGKNIIGMK